MSNNANRQIIDLMMSLHEKLDESAQKLDDKIESLEKRITDLELQISRAKGALAGVLFIGTIIGWCISIFKNKLWS